MVTCKLSAGVHCSPTRHRRCVPTPCLVNGHVMAISVPRRAGDLLLRSRMMCRRQRSHAQRRPSYRTSPGSYRHRPPVLERSIIPLGSFDIGAKVCGAAGQRSRHQAGLLTGLPAWKKYTTRRRGSAAHPKCAGTLSDPAIRRQLVV